MRVAYDKILAATGSSVFEPGYNFAADPSLHKETVRSAGKVTEENYYTTFDPGTEALSGLAVAVTYGYNGVKLETRVVTFYFDDGTVAFSQTTSYKTDLANPNRSVEVRS